MAKDNFIIKGRLYHAQRQWSTLSAFLPYWLSFASHSPIQTQRQAELPCGWPDPPGASWVQCLAGNCSTNPMIGVHRHLYFLCCVFRLALGILCSVASILPLHLWQVCSQHDARFCCAMLCNAKSPAGVQQPSFMLHYSDSGRISHCLF